MAPTLRPLPPMIESDLRRYAKATPKKLPSNRAFSRKDYLSSPPNPRIPTIALTGCGTTYESSGKGQEQFRTDGGGPDRISHYYALPGAPEREEHFSSKRCRGMHNSCEGNRSVYQARSYLSRTLSVLLFPSVFAVKPPCKRATIS